MAVEDMEFRMLGAHGAHVYIDHMIGALCGNYSYLANPKDSIKPTTAHSAKF